MKKKSLRSIVIIHFQPLELYPPVCNLLDYLSKNSTDTIIVISTKVSPRKKLKPYTPTSKTIIINRTPGIVATSRSRVFKFISFYLNSLGLLLKHAPKSVLYFDTISSWPALMYKKLRKNKVRLFAHYHEYDTPEVYAKSMRLVKAMHTIESKMYESFEWLSHTNEIRLDKFIADYGLDNRLMKGKLHVMPNYPSKSFATGKTQFRSSKKTRLVYVGALGFNTTYLKEMLDWALLHKEKVSLDFYSHNLDEKAERYLHTLTAENIKFKGSCNYDELPGILTHYDVGLVVYKPLAENWIHNAPNKVFEYNACGLDVWFPQTMTYMMSLAKESTYPKILPIAFDDLPHFDFEKAIDRAGLSYEKDEFYYENVYGEICKEITG